jgi:hypothetical protein
VAGNTEIRNLLNHVHVEKKQSHTHRVVGRCKKNTLGLMVSRETGRVEGLEEGMEEGRWETGVEDRKRDWEAARGRSSFRY